MKIFLLTHEREFHRATNTGSLALEKPSEIFERILWERTNPNKTLVELIENNEALLLYSNGSASSTIVEASSVIVEASPANVETSPVIVEAYENIIVIDGTWQESQKIFNKSSYLKNIPQFTLKVLNESSYKLRRNQPKGGLCTIECIIEVLKIKGQTKLALKFKQFND